MLSIQDPELLLNYARDASNLVGKPDRVVQPASVEELQAVVRECAASNMPMGISGNGTGLVGGRVIARGTLISLEALDACQIDVQKRCARVQAGLSMREFQSAVSAEGLLYPPDPTEWSAAMGGTWATNASGARSFKYGATRRWVQSLRVILPDGEEVFCSRGDFVARDYQLRLQSTTGREYVLPLPHYRMPPTSKHAAGYYTAPDLDAVDLFLGSEGTLGVLVEAELRLLPTPERVLGMIVFFDELEKLLDCVEFLRHKAAIATTKTLVAPRLVEFFDRNALNFIEPAYPTIPRAARAALWIEQEYEAIDEDETFQEWTDLIARYTELSDECWFAYDERRHAELRAFRHALPSAVYEMISEKRQTKIGTDIAVPEQSFREFFAFYRELFERYDVDYVLFGHIGNCHLHANIFSSERVPYEASLAIYDECIAKGLSLNGTVSAEHGIGKHKRKYLQQMWGEAAIDEMRALRRVLDPQGLLSVGNMFE